ncbi:dipeptidyl peptidase IV N-terminal region-domain-containing protein [Peziza echinospora]|nr:dipeptidyl peptidase IV N-terminal region-domain-containing protein [Peziza echinospora]
MKSLFAPLLLLLGIGLIAPTAAAPPQHKRAGEKLISYADAFSSDFGVQRTSYTWVVTDEGEDGFYLVDDDENNSLIFANVATGEEKVFAHLGNVKGDNGEALQFFNYEIQPNRNHILFATNYTKGYRYSFNASYYVHDIEAGTTVPLIPDQEADIQYAGWSTRGDKIAYVRRNDLYVWQSGEVTRITYDGSVDVFNAVPDWVYEEEIYGDTKTLWWSPDGEYLAFLRMNETGVPTYTVPYYQAGHNLAPPYPLEVDIRYPKVGETNPTVSFHLLKIGDDRAQRIEFSSFAPENLLITEVAWVTDDHSHVIFRTMNRVQDQEKLVLVDVNGGGSTKVVRERDGSDGWIDNNLAIVYVPRSDPPAYVDLSDHSGYTHIYLYPRDGGAPAAITQGAWEVTAIYKIDTARGMIYYGSTERDSTERHLFSVSLADPGANKAPLVDLDEPGYWGASFSSGGGYFLLSYNGPDVPWQKLYSVSADGTTHQYVRTVNDNAKLKNKLAEYKLPTFESHVLTHPDGFELNVLERLPANFDPAKKYPLLFDIYGGPGSQEAGKAYRAVDWSTYIGSDPQLEYIVIAVDNRGTGLKGRAFRAQVAQQLGKLEAADQVWAASEWAKRDYVDENHIVIWGWSYGGYLAAKVVELNTNNVFTRALITAPVSDWRFYDTMYTERYMKLITDNVMGYRSSAILDARGFREIRGGVLVQHGTGDDNVHYQHSAAFIDTLLRNGVTPEKLRVMPFTDSDHSIARQGHRAFLWRQLTDELYDEKNWKPEEDHQWD